MPAAKKSGSGAGAPNDAGSPATRSTRSRIRRPTSSRARCRRSSAPNAVYHCQSDETPSTTLLITYRGLRNADTTSVTSARSEAISSALMPLP